jgi:serine/threonine-protein kinase
LRQVCGALAEAHHAGLVHRDIKPGNIVVAALGGQQDIAKLLDFGLVQDLGVLDTDPRLTQTGTVLGTPAYMCPEQAGGDAPVDARGDVYSLGAVAFFALTGRPPFEGQSVGKLLAAHLTQIPPFLTEIRKNIPVDLARVVERCLAKNPADRFPAITELELALASCGCSGEWSAARAASWWAQESNRNAGSEPDRTRKISR